VTLTPHSSTVVFDNRLAAYDFGPGHPLAPVRVQLAMRLAFDLGLLSYPDVVLAGGIEPVDDELLERVHDRDYIEAVRRASHDTSATDLSRGLGTADDPIFAGMHEAAARVCGATLTATRAVWQGSTAHAVNIAGGLHHAMRGAAEGFCIYNDIAVAITDLLEAGATRVAYVDVDAHHGDGVQSIFWDDPRVLTISIHESPASLFPGTGWPTEIGGAGAEGSAVNIALPAGTGDQGWLRAFHAVVPQVLEAFAPEIIVSQHGVDSHADDPLTNLAMSIDGQRMAAEALHRWSHAYAGGRWVALGGGGYDWVNVCPRAWAHLIAIVSGHPVDPQTEIPEVFREFVVTTIGEVAPTRMTDGRDPWPTHFDAGFHPEDPIDRAVLATRNAVFPHWGLTVEEQHWF
jgi:acetoin utilization protein AcuC